MNKTLDERIYYAQNREDLILDAFFPDVQEGFYVDVGACHPDDVSVTKRFYLKGWRGINIEPQSNLHGLFIRDRPRDINLNIGVGDKNGTMILRSYIYNQGLSSVVDQVKNEHENSEKDSEEYQDLEIPIKTLRDIFETHRPAKINFLKVDVEGFEYQVLAGNDWTKYRPEVVCLEANHVLKDWRPILKKNDYEFVFFDGLNEYYVDTKTNRAKQFNYVEHIINKLSGGLAYDDYKSQEEMLQTKDILEAKLATNSRELKSLRILTKRILRLAPARLKNKILGQTKQDKR